MMISRLGRRGNSPPWYLPEINFRVHIVLSTPVGFMSSAAKLAGLRESKRRDSSHLAAIRQRQCAALATIGELSGDEAPKI
jgi:hypothetical protein